MSFVIDEQHSMRVGFPEVEEKKFLIRAAAYIIDLIVLFGLNLISGIVGGVVFAIVAIIALYILGSEIKFDEDEYILDLICSFIISTLYFGLF